MRWIRYQITNATLLIAIVFQCVIGRAQSADDVLLVVLKCRESYENVSSYEYTASRLNKDGEVRIYVARDGEAWRYDQHGNPIQREAVLRIGRSNSLDSLIAAFDGKKLVSGNLTVLEDIVLEDSSRKIVPTKRLVPTEPFQSCFSFLTKSHSRMEVLNRPIWMDFVSRSETKTSKQLVNGHPCTVITSGLVRGSSREYRNEIAFGEDVGCLPVRVRGLVGVEKEPSTETLLLNFEEFQIDGRNIFFPTKILSRSLQNHNEITEIIKINEESLKINQPISKEVFNVRSDPLGILK